MKMINANTLRVDLEQTINGQEEWYVSLTQIENAPGTEIDPENPPKTATIKPYGYWERPITATTKSYQWRCSECRSIAYSKPEVRLKEQRCTYKYCPYCGIAMRMLVRR